MDRLQAMRQFVTVVDAGSFSAAAKLLNMGQPAVSKSVATLEDYLGVRLLVRTTRSHSLTEAGQRYFERARITLDEADATEAAARDEGAALTGCLRISAPAAYASLQIIPRLSTFLADHPDLTVDLVLDDRRIDLVEEVIDLAIRAGDMDDSTFVAKRIDTAPRHIIGSSEYLAKYGEPETPAALKNHQLITYTGFQGKAAWSFTRGTSHVSVAITGHLQVSAAEGLRAAILAHMGLGLVSERMVTSELISGLVRPVLTEWILPPIDIWAIFPTGRRPTARARLFSDWLANELQASANAEDTILAQSVSQKSTD